MKKDKDKTSKEKLIKKNKILKEDKIDQTKKVKKIKTNYSIDNPKLTVATGSTHNTLEFTSELDTITSQNKTNSKGQVNSTPIKNDNIPGLEFLHEILDGTDFSANNTLSCSYNNESECNKTLKEISNKLTSILDSIDEFKKNTSKDININNMSISEIEYFKTILGNVMTRNSHPQGNMELKNKVSVLLNILDERVNNIILSL